MKVADTTIREFLSGLRSTNPTPGGGAAGALAIALAAACAHKAVIISQRRNSDAVLTKAADELKIIESEACDSADGDALAFGNLMAAFRLPKSTEEENRQRQLAIRNTAEAAAQIGKKIIELADGTASIIAGVEALISKSIINDLHAAAALLEAGRKVQLDNVRENSQLAQRSDG